MPAAPPRQPRCAIRPGERQTWRAGPGDLHESASSHRCPRRASAALGVFGEGTACGGHTQGRPGALPGWPRHRPTEKVSPLHTSEDQAQVTGPPGGQKRERRRLRDTCPLGVARGPVVLVSAALTSVLRAPRPLCLPPHARAARPGSGLLLPPPLSGNSDRTGGSQPGPQAQLTWREPPLREASGRGRCRPNLRSPVRGTGLRQTDDLKGRHENQSRQAARSVQSASAPRALNYRCQNAGPQDPTEPGPCLHSPQAPRWHGRGQFPHRQPVAAAMGLGPRAAVEPRVLSKALQRAGARPGAQLGVHAPSPSPCPGEARRGAGGALPGWF